MQPWMLIVAAAIGAAVLAFFIWYQIRRSRASFTKIDYSKLKDLSQDGWDDDTK